MFVPQTFLNMSLAEGIDKIKKHSVLSINCSLIEGKNQHNQEIDTSSLTRIDK